MMELILNSVKTRIFKRDKNFIQTVSKDKLQMKILKLYIKSIDILKKIGVKKTKTNI